MMPAAGSVIGIIHLFVRNITRLTGIIHLFVRNITRLTIQHGISVTGLTIAGENVELEKCMSTILGWNHNNPG